MRARQSYDIGRLLGSGNRTRPSGERATRSSQRIKCGSGAPLLFRLGIGVIGVSFVITQYHTSVMFAPNCVGTANATSAGWGNLGGGVTQIVMPLVFAGFVALGFTDIWSWRFAMLTAGGVLFLTGLAYYFLTQDLPDGKEYLTGWYGYQRGRIWERSFRKRFERSGLLVAESNDISHLVREAARHISPIIYGEAIVSVGKGVNAEREGYDGVILIGPFNCLPYRISEAILKPYLRRSGAPILSYESDGYAVPPAFLRQVEVHIQQVLERWEERRTPTPAGFRARWGRWAP